MILEKTALLGQLAVGSAVSPLNIANHTLVMAEVIRALRYYHSR